MTSYIGNSVSGQSADSTIYLPVRQTALIGELDSAGVANSLSAGSGLRVTLTATANPLVLAMATGFGGYGATDLVSRLIADDADITGTDLAVDNTTYIYADYVDNDAVTWGDVLAPPQYGQIYDRTKQANLHFDGSAGATTTTDDYGNTWTAQGGAKLQTDEVKIGTAGLGGGGTSNVLNGTSDNFRTSDITSLSPDGWTMECWVRPTALPGAGNTLAFLNFATTGNREGVRIGINNTTGTIRWAYALSSNGTSNDIESEGLGTTTPVVDTWYHFAITWDKKAGIYRMYIDGTQEQSTTSALYITGGDILSIGLHVDSANGLECYIDEFMLRPYCAYPDGTAFTAPAAAFDVTTDISSNFFSIPQMKMFEVTGASATAGVDPTLTQVNRVYVGEADTDGSSVTAVRNYAYRGKAELRTPDASAAQSTDLQHNIGVIDFIYDIVLVANVELNEWHTGDRLSEVPNYYDGTNLRIRNIGGDKNMATLATHSNVPLIVDRDGAGGTALVSNGAGWQYLVRFNRNW